MLRTTRFTLCAYREWAATLREGWTKNRSKHNPFFMGMEKKYWEAIPEFPEGCHVMDVAGVFQDDEKFREVNNLLKKVKEETGVEVRFYLFGDIGSHVTKDLARRIGGLNSEKTKYHNTLTIVASRKNGTLDTYSGSGVFHITNPYWVNSHFNSIFKVYFKGREWDVKLQEYAEAISKTLSGKKGQVQTTGTPILPFFFKYWWGLLAAAVILIKAVKDYYEYWCYWNKRWCGKCQKFMEGWNDPDLMQEYMTLGQKKEVELDCVEYALWKCPTEDCEEGFVEEVRWNSLRNDCLICLKCRHRTSWGRRVVGNTPDIDNQGEAVNIRTCKFCGFEEAWLSLISANLGANSNPEHDRQTVGTYGNAWQRSLHSSFLGKFMFPGEGAPAAEIRKGGVGELSDKTHSYKHSG